MICDEISERAQVLQAQPFGEFPRQRTPDHPRSPVASMTYGATNRPSRPSAPLPEHRFSPIPGNHPQVSVKVGLGEDGVRGTGRGEGVGGGQSSG